MHACTLAFTRSCDFMVQYDVLDNMACAQLKKFNGKYGHAKQFDKRAVSIVNCCIWPFPDAALKASVHCSDIL